MLGGGARGELNKCPSNPFVTTLEKIGDSVEMTFPGSDMACSRAIKVKCGAPSF
jgi:hypothetical protein